MPRPKYGYFQIFKDGGRRHLGFSNFKIFNDRTVKVGELHQRAKFRENLLNRGRNTAIFRFFQDGGRRHLGFLKFQIFNGRNG